ncbi:CoA ester lyase [uncultured Jannaschia sp.]|uniref:HpcH/HpaI aldolase/citrate lyase family protein n=1 Tax=uncultured Jannaschia sp. TaxID=293347 RepID=UPI00260C91A0|nr:CoA ester lyase [uncultured Jannaschia sp.]
MPELRPLRSVLYVPASNRRALEKAAGLPVDAIVFDLEDAVAPGAKDDARRTLTDMLREADFGRRMRIVRINGAATELGAADLAAVADLPIDALLLPKVDVPDDVARVADALAGRARVWAMMETALGISNAAAIARVEGIGGFVLGTNDLAQELGCRPGPDRMPLMTALQTCLLAARLGGVPCIDGVFNAFRDADGLRAECEQGRDLGMDGKSLIHPAQIAVANEIFAPDGTDVDLARRQIAAFEDATARGQGVAVLDGRIVENLHIDMARRTLARAAAIARQESGT